MRTTIEIPDHQRAKLLALAARRGLKGFSGLVQEALDKYLDECEKDDQRIAAALSAIGSLSEKEAEKLETAINTLRAQWR